MCNRVWKQIEKSQFANRGNCRCVPAPPFEVFDPVPVYSVQYMYSTELVLYDRFSDLRTESVPVFLPVTGTRIPYSTVTAVKRHRGEPGHTRDTRDTRAHAGTRITRTNLTTIHPNPTTHTCTRTKTATDSTAARTATSPESTAPRGRLRRGRPRRTRPCLHPLPERLPAPTVRVPGTGTVLYPCTGTSTTGTPKGAQMARPGARSAVGGLTRCADALPQR